MADDWDSVDEVTSHSTTPAVPVPVQAALWDDEDVEEEAPDAWDAEEEDKPSAAAGPKEPPKPKALTKQQLKKKLEAEAREVERKVILSLYYRQAF
jgi:hypothetical protein